VGIRPGWHVLAGAFLWGGEMATERLNEKRTHAVKLLLNDEEFIQLMEQANAQDLAAADVLRRAWLRDTFGSVGLARLRAKRARGDDSELQRTDWVDSAFADGLER
jgi:hypothetical protein